VVSEVDRGGPAASAGLLHGDLVQSIDGQPPSPGGLLDLGRSLREGQAVRLTGSRQGAAGPLSIELVAVRTRPPIIEHKLLPGKVGYLRLHYLPHSEDPTADAAAQLSGALGELDRARVSRLVIDLRDSTGGAPFDVASILVRGDPLLRIQPPGEPVLPVERTRPAWKVRRKTAVLVNDQSYAAAEMIALALTDHGEARSFGQPTGGALSLPGQAELPGGVLLFYPQALVAGARTAPPAARRVEPDERVANTGPDDYRAGRDPQLAAALAWLKRR
jgi:carboxyl-terminal processing protease